MGKNKHKHKPQDSTPKGTEATSPVDREPTAAEIAEANQGLALSEIPVTEDQVPSATPSASAIKPSIPVAAVPPEEAAAIAENTITVSMKDAWERLRQKLNKSMPLDFKFVTGVKKTEIPLVAALQNAVLELLPSDATVPLAISRRRILNAFCIGNGIMPEPSKRSNKVENKAVATYGVVPQFEDSFPVDGPNYPILGFLKFPVVHMQFQQGDGVVELTMFKYDTDMILMDTAQFNEHFSKGHILDDVNMPWVH